MNSIGQWLERHGFGKYVCVFAENDVGLDIITDLTEEQLGQLGVTLGDRVRMLKAIADLEAGQRGTGAIPVDGAVAGGTDAENRHLTVMFADLVGSTALAERLDPEALRDINRAYQNTATAIIESHGGYVARYMGDGVLAYFGYPRAHEDDAQRAVRAGLQLVKEVSNLEVDTQGEREPGLEVRVGIATGPVIVGDVIGQGASQETAVSGKTPNLAARLQSAADPGSVVIAPSTYKLTAGHFRYQDLGYASLKGIATPVRLWRAQGRSDIQSRFEADRGRQMTPFVGRDEELALVLSRWDRAREGEGQVVVISGEPGIGKSRLTDTVRRRIAEQSHTVMHFQCSPFHANSSLYPVISQLAHASNITASSAPEGQLGQLDRYLRESRTATEESLTLFADLLSIPAEGRLPSLDLDAQQRKDRTLMALLSHLGGKSSHKPVLLVFEDVHWIDPTTLELLTLLMARIESVPVLLLVTHRPEFIAPWTTQATTSALTLARIGSKDSRAMIEALTGQAGLTEETFAEIVAKADGVPLFVEELARTVVDIGEEQSQREEAREPPRLEIPLTLRDLLAARLDRLSQGKRVAQIAAVLGREFSHDLLAAVSELGSISLEEGLEQLVTGGLILSQGTESGGSFIFKHALVQDAAYESLLKSKRRGWHSRVVEVLEQRHPGTVGARPEVLAHHCTEAGLADKAIEYLQLSGERASDRGASSEAINHFQKALDLLTDGSDSANRASRQVCLQIGLAANLRVVDRVDDALVVLQQAQSTAAAHDFALELSKIHHLLGNLCFPRGDIDGCLREHRMSLRFAREAGSVDCEVAALGGLGDAEYVRGRMLSANRAFSQTVELCRDNGLSRAEVAHSAMVVHTRLYLGDMNGALDAARAAIAAATGTGHERAELIAHNAAVIALFAMGDIPRAEDLMARREDLVRHLGARRFEPESLRFRARVLANRGERQAAVELLEKAMQISRETAVGFLGPWILVDLASLVEDSRSRRETLEEAEKILHAGSVSHNHLWFYPGAIDTSVAGDDWVRVEHYAAALHAYARSEPLPWSDFHVARARALTAHAAGKRDEATMRELRTARQRAAEIGLTPSLPVLDRALAS